MDDLMGRLQDVLNDPESMKQIGELAKMLSAGESAPEPGPPAAPAAPAGEALPDMGSLIRLGQVMQSAARDDPNIRLLTALRPLLREETRPKLDRVIRLYRLVSVYPALKESGLTGGDLLGIFG